MDPMCGCTLSSVFSVEVCLDGLGLKARASRAEGDLGLSGFGL